MNANRIVIFTLLTVFWAATAVAEVVATVDRASLVVDETLTLTITKDGSSLFTDPDLEPLQKDFKVLGRSQQSSTQIINGSASSSVSWRITLAPRRAGNLEIPPISVGKEKTSPLVVQVNAEAPAKTRGDNVPIFIETDVDEQSVFVQSQVIYTLRVYWAVDIQIVDPGEPNVPDALIQQLDDATFEKVIDGTTYRVFERKYAIFPQKSGEVEIPQMIVQVNIPSRSGRRSFFDTFGSRGEVLKLRSEEEKLTVKEKPQEYPASAVWLPSAGLVMKDEWSQDPLDLKVGESATLTLSITADGLLAEQLPPVEMVEPEGVKVYQGKAEVENLTTSLGIIGTRKESIALIPTRPGEIEIPEIRIPWWDKNNRKVEYAVIPAKKIVVKGTARQQETAPPDAIPDNKAPAVPALPMVEQPGPGPAPTLWIIVCAVLAAAWLVTLCMLLYTRRQMKTLSAGQAGNQEKERAVRERDVFNAFSRACRANDLAEARVSIMSWARIFWPREKIQTFSDITRIVQDPELLPLLREIDSKLYSQERSPDQWQGAKLLARIAELRKAEGKGKQNKEGLQKLYK